ncbi:hypothetical protein B0H16DRAFT_1474701 [Mycena metata]|uniref:Uncharacterized protein n=1 Tax=Mycena metata TaxID=1033252 RepID=A0AAD7HGS3_9AGAR|nr:hypothetical protein B0H16DRAFT_1474701 [Mycena metata]
MSPDPPTPEAPDPFSPLSTAKPALWTPQSPRFLCAKYGREEQAKMFPHGLDRRKCQTQAVAMHAVIVVVGSIVREDATESAHKIDIAVAVVANKLGIYNGVTEGLNGNTNTEKFEHCIRISGKASDGPGSADSLGRHITYPNRGWYWLRYWLQPGQGAGGYCIGYWLLLAAAGQGTGYIPAATGLQLGTVPATYWAATGLQLGRILATILGRCWAGYRLQYWCSWARYRLHAGLLLGRDTGYDTGPLLGKVPATILGCYWAGYRLRYWATAGHGISYDIGLLLGEGLRYCIHLRRERLLRLCAQWQRSISTDDTLPPWGPTTDDLLTVHLEQQTAGCGEDRYRGYVESDEESGNGSDGDDEDFEMVDTFNIADVYRGMYREEEDTHDEDKQIP